MNKHMLDKIALHAGTVVMVMLSEKITIKDEENLVMNVYENGREHGFNIANRTTKKSVNFAEHRSSDDLVVYFGATKEFDPEDGMFIPSEKVYTKAKFFKGDMDGWQRASEFILKYLSIK